MFSRAVIACLLAATLAGCAGGASLFGPATGTATGLVQVRACGGPNRPQQTACPVRPVAGATLTFELSGGSGSSAVTTDSAGRYRIDLKPGTYHVHVSEKASSTQSKLPAVADNQAAVLTRTVDVVAGTTVTEDFTYTIQLM